MNLSFYKPKSVWDNLPRYTFRFFAKYISCISTSYQYKWQGILQFLFDENSVCNCNDARFLRKHLQKGNLTFRIYEEKKERKIYMSSLRQQYINISMHLHNRQNSGIKNYEFFLHFAGPFAPPPPGSTYEGGGLMMSVLPKPQDFIHAINDKKVHLVTL